MNKDYLKIKSQLTIEIRIPCFSKKNWHNLLLQICRQLLVHQVLQSYYQSVQPFACDIYNLLTVDPKNNKIDKIIEALKDLKGVANHSVLLRKTRLEAKEFRSLIETTIESGQVEAIDVKNQKNGKKTIYYRYIDWDKIIFEDPSPPSSQILQVPRFTYTIFNA
jgi:hypothetical protein